MFWNFGGVKCHLVFITDYAYWKLLSKDFEPDKGPVHFRSSGALLLNLAGIKYENNVHNILFA